MDSRLALPNKTELAGDYRIKGILGAGGFGVTYVAEETSLDRDVAIKEYFPAEFASREKTLKVYPKSASVEKDYKWGLDRFVEEAKTLAKFNHANIVRVYRYFLENETAYMVLHLEQGKTFKKWIEKLKRRPSQLELVSVIAPLLNALELIHSNDFLHRDITPDNIMIRHNGSPVLIDFGSARGQMAYGSKTVSALIKPGYSPFEQYAVTSKDQGPWTDIYSLGATLYQAVTGRRPMDAPTRLVNDELVPAIECVTGYSPAFLRAIDQSLCIPIDKRPQSIAEWRDLFRVEKITQTPVAEVALDFRSNDPLDAGYRNNNALPKPSNGEQARKASGARARSVEDKRLRRATVKLSTKEEKGPVAKKGSSLMSRINNVRIADKSPAIKRRSSSAPGSFWPRRKKPASNNIFKSLRLKPGAFLNSLNRRKKYGKSQTSGPKDVAAAAIAPIFPPRIKERKKAKAVKPPIGKRFGIRPKIHALTLALLFLQFTGAVGIASAIVYFQDLLPSNNWTEADTGLITPDGIELVATLSGHREAITAIANSADGTKIISGSYDDTVKVWDLASQKNILTIYGHNTDVSAVAVHDRFLISADRGGKVILTDVETGTEIKVFESVDSTLSSIAFTGRGNRFITAGRDATVRLWDGEQNSDKPSRSIKAHRDPITSLAYSKQRGLLVTGSTDNTIKLWRASNSRLIRTYRGHNNNIDAIAISPNGRMIAAACQDGTVKIWSTRSRRVVHTLKGHKGKVNSVAFSPDGILLVAGSKDQSITIWNLKTGHLIKKFYAHHGSVNSVVFSEKGDLIISGGEDNKIRLWNLNLMNIRN